MDSPYPQGPASGSPEQTSPGAWNHQIRLWSLVTLVAFVAADLAVLRSYDARAQAVSPSTLVHAAFVAAIGGTVLVLLALVLFWRRLEDRHLSAVALVLFLVIGLGPGLAKGVGRIKRGPASMIFDTLLHVEVAARLLSHGTNPYGADYSGTEMGQWHQGSDRVQIHHLVYPPLPVLLTVPASRVCTGMLGGYDSRLVFLPMLGLAAVLCWRSWSGNPWRSFLLTVAFLNPLMFGHHQGGKLDTLVLIFLLFGLQAAARGRPLVFAACLGLAAATKTNFILAAPFGLLWMAADRREAWRWVGAWVLAFLPWFIPFLIWNPVAMMDDLLVAPLRGSGADPLLVDAGPFGGAWPAMLAGGQPSFPFWIVQAPATLAVGAVGGIEVRRRRTALAFGLAGAVTMAVFFYFNRFSDSAYFGTFLSWVAASAGFGAASISAPKMDPGSSSG